MRASGYLVLLAGVLVVLAAIVNASAVVAFLNAQTEGVRYVLFALAVAVAFVWRLVLRLSLTIDQREVQGKIDAQRGRETGSRLRQKSVDLSDRQDALEQNISTADERRALREWIVGDVALPYFVLAVVAGVALWLALLRM